MQFGKDTALRLLIVDDSVEAAEAIVSALRNAGIAVRPSRPDNEDELSRHCSTPSRSTWCWPPSNADRRARWRRSCRPSTPAARTCPCCCWSTASTRARLLEALAAGARGVALRDADHIAAPWCAPNGPTSRPAAPAPARSAGARDRAPLRRADRILARPDRLHPRRHAHPRQRGLPGNVRLRILRRHRGHVAAGPGRARSTSTTSRSCSSSCARARRRRRATSSRRARSTATSSRRSWNSPRPPTKASPACRWCCAAQELDPELAREVEELRQRDQVTGLLNRPTFLRALEDAVADAAQKRRTTACCWSNPTITRSLLQDIGLDAADDLVAACAQRLRDGVGRTTSCRALRRTPVRGAAPQQRPRRHPRSPESVRAAFAEHVVEMGNRSLNATVSIGGVQIGEKIASVAAVLAKASQGVQSRSAWAATASRSSTPARSTAPRKSASQAWVARIRDALDTDRFLMHYQPLISLHGEPGEMYEAYLRLRGEHGRTGAAADLPADRRGTRPAVGNRPLGRGPRASDVIGERQRAGHAHHAAGQDHPGLAAGRQPGSSTSASSWPATAPTAACWSLQLPESKVFTNLRAAQEFQARRGASSASASGLEQFGAGLNSFQLLTHFDAEFLKIDRASWRTWPAAPSTSSASARSPTRRASWASRPSPSTCRTPAA